MAPSTVKIAKVEDHEGFGRCQECDREGLRWVITLSDGRQVGSECAKQALGFRIRPSEHSWVTGFDAVAEHVEYGETRVLWQSKTGAQSRETRSGLLVRVGGARREWESQGWL